MPLFEYRCESCGTVFETLVRTAAEKPEKCPKCGGAKLVKQFSTFAAGRSDTGTDFSACSSGTCGTGACPTGTCPFSPS